MDDAAVPFDRALETRLSGGQLFGRRVSSLTPVGAADSSAFADQRDSCGRPLLLLSNREPYEHVATPEGLEIHHPAGGLVTALDPTLRRTRGVWVAWGSGTGDRDASDAEGRVAVPPPPAESRYTLRRVWLDDRDVEGYYLGFANSVLWPLCHLLIHHFRLRDDDWARYQSVNRRFADAALDEAARLQTSAGRTPVVWIQDYHLAVVAESIRAAAPQLFIHQFWHIPFPPPDILHLLPYGIRESLLRGLLGNDLLEFHTERYALNFLECAAQLLPGAAVDRKRLSIRYAGRSTALGAYPISIDVDHFESLADAPEARARSIELRRRYAPGARQLGVSVDRVDYTKGIPERLRALEVLWDGWPELRDRFTMLIVTAPSRFELRPYRALRQEIEQTVAALNQRFGTASWTPIVLLSEAIPPTDLAAIYRAADLCLVSSLQDGMNLVAKEFVACQADERGVLVLSRFAGAAEEIDGAVLVNPFNVDGFAAGIRAALEMPVAERGRRMREMRERLRRATVFDWLDAITARVEAMGETAGEANGVGGSVAISYPERRL
jgi:alpha,alpha-trehalose-phosphate synthase [UDP-forming]